MATVPLQAAFRGDFATLLVLVDDEDTMEVVAQKVAYHVIGYLLSDNLHRVLVIYEHEQRGKIAAESRLKRNCGHTLRSLLAGGRGCRLQLFKSPGIVHRVIALLGRGKAHIGPYARHVRWLNMAGQKAVND